MAQEKNQKTESALLSKVWNIGGLYSYSLNGYVHVGLPVSPQIAITLIENAGIPFLEKKGITRLYLITEDKYVAELNRFAFQQQCKQNYGYVISPVKDALEELLPMCQGSTIERR
jgi:hypothetical protein